MAACTEGRSAKPGAQSYQIGKIGQLRPYQTCPVGDVEQVDVGHCVALTHQKGVVLQLCIDPFQALQEVVFRDGLVDFRSGFTEQR